MEQRSGCSSVTTTCLPVRPQRRASSLVVVCRRRSAPRRRSSPTLLRNIVLVAAAKERKSGPHRRVEEAAHKAPDAGRQPREASSLTAMQQKQTTKASAAAAAPEKSDPPPAAAPGAALTRCRRLPLAATAILVLCIAVRSLGLPQAPSQIPELPHTSLPARQARKREKGDTEAVNGGGGGRGGGREREAERIQIPLQTAMQTARCVPRSLSLPQRYQPSSRAGFSAAFTSRYRVGVPSSAAMGIGPQKLRPLHQTNTPQYCS